MSRALWPISSIEAANLFLKERILRSHTPPSWLALVLLVTHQQPSLRPYHTGRLCRQFVRLFCWATDLEHPHARKPVVIEALYPTITTSPLLPSAAYMRCSAKSFDFNLRRDHQ